MTSLSYTRLTRLRLSHFRSHHQTELMLDGRPVALFGANGAGKTNILEAVSLLSPGRGLRRALAPELIRQPEALGWKVKAEVVSSSQPYDIELSALPDAPRQTRIDGRLVPQNALAALVRILWLVPAMDRLWIEGAEGRRRFLDRTTLSFTPEHADHVLAYEKAMRARNRLLKEGVRDAHWYLALEAQMANAGAAIATSRAAALVDLTEAQRAGSGMFPRAELMLTGEDVAATQVDPEALKDALAASRPRDMAAGRTLVGPHRVDLEATFQSKGVAARQCSTGEQKALLISLILANARALRSKTGAAPLLLLDEVAAHLDQSRRAALYDEICALEAQAFLTGTGQELFTEFGVRASAMEVCDLSGITTINEVAL